MSTIKAGTQSKPAAATELSPAHHMPTAADRAIRLLIPVAVGLLIWFVPAPDGVNQQAWHLFAIFVATIVGVIAKPLPMGAVTLIGIVATTRALAASPLAVLHWHGVEEEEQPEEVLFGAIEHRYTSRAPFAPARITARQWQDITAAGQVGEVLTSQSTPAFTRDFLELTAIADAELVDDPAYLAELEQWVGRHGRDGIPQGAVGVHDTTGGYPGRDFSLTTSQTQSQLPQRPFEKAPQLAVIHSPHDTPLQWLQAGRAVERVALRATAAGLRVGILGQAIEDPQTHRVASDKLSSTLGSPTVLQQILRLGYGDGTPRPAATERRRVSEVLSVR